MMLPEYDEDGCSERAQRRSSAIERHPKMRFLYCLGVLAAVLISGSSAQPGGSAALQQLTAFRKNHRRTVDGRLCAAAFVQDDQTYTDCTTARAPNGTTAPFHVQITRLDGSIYQTDKAKKRWAAAHAAAALSLSGLNSFLNSRLEALCGKRHEAVGAQLELIEKTLNRSGKCVKKLAAAHETVDSLKKMIKETHHQVIQQEAAAARKPENCGLIPGYEEAPLPDGINGAYFDNASFEGPPRIRRKDRNIDFSFSGAGPLDNLAGHKYSIRWDGYLLIPRTAHYVFSTETDNGARVFLNDQPITADRMPHGTATDATGNKRVPLVAIAERAGTHEAASPPIRLTGKQKYKIRVEFVHNTHFLVASSDHGSLRIDPKLFALSLLLEGSPAYSDNSQFHLHGIPGQLNGLRYLRTAAAPSLHLVEFRVNQPTTLFVGYPENKAFPLAPFEDYLWKAHDTQLAVAVRKGQEEQADGQTEMKFALKRIYHRGGPISFSVAHTSVPFFVALAPTRAASAACGGEETNLSLSAGPYFLHCLSSSQEAPQFGCGAALSGSHMDGPYGVWRSGTGNGNGEYISLAFSQPVQIVKFLFMPPADPLMWPSEITLTFDDSETEVFSILHSGNIEHHSYLLTEPRVVTVLKVEVTQMYVSGSDSGGSFEFWGVPCVTDEEDVSLPPPVHALECLDTVSTVLQGGAPQPGLQFIGVCDSKCFSDSTVGSVYGSNWYALESAICSVGLHAGLCSRGAPCELFLTVTGPQAEFKAAKKNGVSSMAHGPADKSIAVAHASCTHSLLRDQPLKLKVHFGKTERQPLPPGWVADAGAVKQRRGRHFFGWLQPAKPAACEAHEFANALNVGGLVFAALPEVESGSKEQQQTENSPANFWSLSVPLNGRYLVAAEVGNPCGGPLPGDGAATAFLEANGLPLVANVKLQRNKFYMVRRKSKGGFERGGQTKLRVQATAFVEVTERLLVLTSTCREKPSEASAGNACEHALTTIFNLTVEKL
ncbi:hypothetical protein Efla_000314 [Eimeria flavescens]